MSDERARILKLLEDGRITADQAARLIEAVGRRVPPVPPMPPMAGLRVTRRHIDRIPEIVAEAVQSAVHSGFEAGEEGEEEFAGKRRLTVKSVSGDVEVAGGRAEGVRVGYGGGMVKVRAKGDGVQVRSVSGDVSAAMPSDGALEAETVSGNVTVERVGGELRLRTVSGDLGVEDAEGGLDGYTVSGNIELERVAGRLGVESRSGDISVEAAGRVTGALATRSGNITLQLARPGDVELELACEEDGRIDLRLEMPHEVLAESDELVRVRVGAGGEKLVVRTGSGDITVEDREEE
jgi:DUF4097 and DUF4098 domain-containing protein YvlB